MTEPSESLDEVDTEADEVQPEQEPAEVTAEKTEDDAPADENTSDEETKPEEDTSEGVDGAEHTNGGLRNRRLSGKITVRRRRRLRGGVAVED